MCVWGGGGSTICLGRPLGRLASAPACNHLPAARPPSTRWSEKSGGSGGCGGALPLFRSLYSAHPHQLRPAPPHSSPAPAKALKPLPSLVTDQRHDAVEVEAPLRRVLAAPVKAHTLHQPNTPMHWPHTLMHWPNTRALGRERGAGAGRGERGQGQAAGPRRRVATGGVGGKTRVGPAPSAVAQPRLSGTVGDAERVSGARAAPSLKLSEENIAQITGWWLICRLSGSVGKAERRALTGARCKRRMRAVMAVPPPPPRPPPPAAKAVTPRDGSRPWGARAWGGGRWQAAGADGRRRGPVSRSNQVGQEGGDA